MFKDSNIKNLKKKIKKEDGEESNIIAVYRLYINCICYILIAF